MKTDSASTTGITAVPAPPIATMAELRRQHSALLQRDVAGTGTAKPTPGEMLGFLECASKLGRSLSDIDGRESAQGIMDYWVAQLLNQAPQAGESSRPFSLESFDECGAHLMAQDAMDLRSKAAEVVTRAGAVLTSAREGAVPAGTPPLAGLAKIKVSRLFEWVPGWMKPMVLRATDRNGDAGVLRRLLLGFIRLKEKSLEAYSVPLALDDPVLKDAKVEKMLRDLLDAGIVRQQQAAGPGESKPPYVLTHESLLTGWTFLVEVIKQRRAFRELAGGWENGGRQPAALLHSGLQLEQALDYPHVDASETAFIEASRRAGENVRRIALGVAVIGITVLALLLAQQRAKSRELADKSAELATANTKLTEQSNTLAETNAALKTQSTKLEAANGELTQKSKDLAAANDALTQKRKDLETANAELTQKGRDLADANAKLTQKSEELAQQLAIAYTSKSYFKSLNEQFANLKAKPELSSSIKDLLSNAVNRKAPPPQEAKGMVELFVAAGVAGMVEAAEPLAKDLAKRGFELPAGQALPRRHVYDQTEVRFFHSADRALADEVADILKGAGLKGEATVEDHTKEKDDAPKKFIQISIGRTALKPTGPARK